MVCCSWPTLYRRYKLLGINRIPITNGGTWVLDQLNLEGLVKWTEDQQKAAKDLLVASADVFSKDDLDLGKCNILTMTLR